MIFQSDNREQLGKLIQVSFHTEFVDLTTDTIADIRNIKINRDNFCIRTVIYIMMKMQLQ